MDGPEKPLPGAPRNIWHQFRDWLDEFLGHQPESRQELVDVIQQAQKKGLFDQDALDTLLKVGRIEPGAAQRTAD